MNDMTSDTAAFSAGADQFDGVLGSRRAGKVLVVANDNSHRATVTNFLASRDHAFAVASTVQDVLLQFKSDRFDLVVCAMRDADGFELMRQVRQIMPGLPVVMIALGAAELDAVQIDCAIGLKREIFGDQQGVFSRLASLTARERQVLNLIVAGRANKVIAYELSISPRTVENHRARVMEKLRVKSVAELVRLALSAPDFSYGRPVKLSGANDTALHHTVPA